MTKKSWLFKEDEKEKEDGAVSHEEPGHRIPSDDEGVNATTKYRPRRQHTLKDALSNSVDEFLAKGGGGSGNFSHEGRPGEVGGSGEGGGPSVPSPSSSSSGGKGQWSQAFLTPHNADHNKIENTLWSQGVSKNMDARTSDTHDETRSSVAPRQEAGGKNHSEFWSKEKDSARNAEHLDRMEHALQRGGFSTLRGKSSDGKHDAILVRHASDADQPQKDLGVLGNIRANIQDMKKEAMGQAVDTFITKDWGTATPQGSTMPATGLQDTNLGPGQKKRCATCGKVKCKCR